MPTNQELEARLEDLPDQVADAMIVWRKAAAERARLEGKRHLELKVEMEGQGKKITTDDLRAMVKADEACYAAVMCELAAEATYTRLYEKLLAAKRFSALRTAY